MIEILSILIIGFAFGWIAREYHALRYLRKIEKQSRIQETQDNIEELIVDIHEIDGVFYAYDREDGSFVIQANTIQELENNIGDMFPTKLIKGYMEVK